MVLCVAKLATGRRFEVRNSKLEANRRREQFEQKTIFSNMGPHCGRLSTRILPYLSILLPSDLVTLFLLVSNPPPGYLDPYLTLPKVQVRAQWSRV